MRTAEERGDLAYIGIRHEGAASFAASAFGKLTGRLAGAGSTNLLTGLYDAKVDRSPVLAISGQVPTKVKGRGAFQDLDLAAAFADVAAYSETVLPGSDHVELMSLACKTALIERDVSQTHHTVAKTSMPRQMPPQVGSAAMNAVHGVNAKTKTRSKNNSSGPTDSLSRSSALNPGVRVPAFRRVRIAGEVPVHLRPKFDVDRQGATDFDPGSQLATRGLVVRDGLDQSTSGFLDQGSISWCRSRRDRHLPPQGSPRSPGRPSPPTIPPGLDLESIFCCTGVAHGV